MDNSHDDYWLNLVLDEIEKRYPEGEIVISSGISPSASYHIGHFREILSSNMIKVGLQARGRQAKHLHVVDNFDPLRKRYDFLPEQYEKYIGWPVCLVPDPYGCHPSYAEHFFQEFIKWVEVMELEFEVVRSYEDLYKTGRMQGQIEKAVASVEKVKEIFKKISNRDLGADWMPLQILSDSNDFISWRYKSIDIETKTIEASDNTGDHQVKYDSGRVKLSWRLDWPARWQVLGVMVEPHGFQEHGAAGGSYETGIALAKEVFGFDGPIAGFQYGHVHLVGDNIKMSSSKGNLITPEQAFSIVPPELIRYFYARYSGKKRIDFDPGIGLMRMMDEFAEVDQAVRTGQSHEFASAYRIATADGAKNSQSMSSIPFSHLVNVYQAALGDEKQILNLLKISGYEQEAQTQAKAINSELIYVRNWLNSWAPDDVKSELKEKLPEVDLSDQQKAFLSQLATTIEGAPTVADGQWFHTAIHAAREAIGLEPSEAFRAVYRVLLDKDKGPRAGLFLSILDRGFLIKRLQLEQ